MENGVGFELKSRVRNLGSLKVNKTRQEESLVREGILLLLCVSMCIYGPEFYSVNWKSRSLGYDLISSS